MPFFFLTRTTRENQGLVEGSITTTLAIPSHCSRFVVCAICGNPHCLLTVGLASVGILCVTSGIIHMSMVSILNKPIQFWKRFRMLVFSLSSRWSNDGNSVWLTLAGANSAGMLLHQPDFHTIPIRMGKLALWWDAGKSAPEWTGAGKSAFELYVSYIVILVLISTVLSDEVGMINDSHDWTSVKSASVVPPYNFSGWSPGLTPILVCFWLMWHYLAWQPFQWYSLPGLHERGQSHWVLWVE